MFTGIGEGREKLLRKVMFLSLLVEHSVSPKEYDAGFKNVRHNIYMRSTKGLGIPTPIFSCTITHTRNMFIMTNLKTEGSGKMDEASLHFYLGWVIEEAQVWAKNAQKPRLLIESRLPHITEWFVEHGYDVRLVDIMSSDKGYRGVKEDCVMDA